MKFILPFTGSYPMTQSFDEHIQRAKNNGWCYKPGNCPGGVYYYGGVDYGLPVGTPILASADGEVTKAENLTTGYGIYVKLKHAEGFETIYGHNSVLKVKIGQKVKAGDVIALSGNSGFSSGSHTHWESRLNGVPVDPMKYLSSSPVPVIPTNPTQTVSKLPLSASYTVSVDMLNIRTGPGTEYPLAGSLKNGDKINITNITGSTIWVEIEEGQWVALSYNGEFYVS